MCHFTCHLIYLSTPSSVRCRSFHQERVCLDLMRGMSLDDLHAGLAQRGSEPLLDRMLWKNTT